MPRRIVPPFGLSMEARSGLNLRRPFTIKKKNSFKKY